MRTKLIEKYFSTDSVGIEIGVHLGEFSKILIDTCKPKLFYAVDPWIVFEDPKYENAIYGKQFNQKQLDQRYEFVKQKFQNDKSVKIIRDYSFNAVKLFEDCFFDWMYLDGDHSYQGVLSDLENFGQKIKPGGYIIGDDYKKGKWWKDGVIKAVDDFVADNKFDIIETKYEQFVLKKI